MQFSVRNKTNCSKATFVCRFCKNIEGVRFLILINRQHHKTWINVLCFLCNVSKLYFMNHFYSIYYIIFFSYLTSLLPNGSRNCSQSTRNSIIMYLPASEDCTLISLVNLWMTFNIYPISRNEMWYFTNEGQLLMLYVVGGKVCAFQIVYSWAKKLKASFRFHYLFVPPFNLNIFMMTASYR
jgi:hypothetical protein